MFLERFPENFPDPAANDPDRRPYDLLILGDVSPSTLGKEGGRAVQKFVKEGGGLVVIAGRQHAPADYLGTPLAELLPVEFARKEFKGDVGRNTQPYQPVLTLDGETSSLMVLADVPKENLLLWRQDLWQDAKGFYWHYPVTGLRPGAWVLLVHPDEKTGERPNEKPMPLFAWQYYGKGQVLFLATDESWRWRYNTGDRLTARFWGQIVLQLGLPHLVGNSERVQLRLEQSEAILGRPAR